MAKSFSIGGVHPPDNKLSRGEAIVRMPVPEQVVVLTGQHIGAPAAAVVAKGDKVKAGQVVAAAAGFPSSSFFLSVSLNKLQISEWIVCEVN